MLVIIDSDLLRAVGTSEGTQIWGCAKFSFCSLVSLPLRLGVCHVSEVFHERKHRRVGFKAKMTQ